MSEQELQKFIKAIEEERIKNTQTPGAAQKLLRELGFLDENGELNKQYAKSKNAAA